MGKGVFLGKGMTAEVYEWEQDKIIKLYFKWFKEQWIKHEEEVAEAVNTAGISSPAVYGIVDEEGQKGIIYQRINGSSMLRLIEIKPWKVIKYAREMAHIHSEIHKIHIDTLPNQKEKFEAQIIESSDILGDKTEGIINYLKNLPEDTCVCHGDFHPDNILISSEKPVVIDWINAHSGNPLGDVARTCLIIRTPYMPKGMPNLLIKISKIIKRLLCSAFLREYAKISKIHVKDVDDWVLPVAAARLRDKVPGEEKWLLNIIDSYIKKKNV